MVQENAYRSHLESRDIAPSAIRAYLYALKRIERDEGVDLDREYERDKLESLISKYQYSAQDERDGRPNPTKIAIEQKNVRSFLAWFRNHIVRYKNFLGGSVEADPSAVTEIDPANDEVEEATTRKFALEHDLQSALRQNLAQLEQGLVIADSGREVKVEGGFIDILAKDASGQWVVIELKSDVAKPDAVAQILAYMGCIATEKGGQVRGILVAADFAPRVTHAARAVPNLALRRYGFRFEFS